MRLSPAVAALAAVLSIAGCSSSAGPTVPPSPSASRAAVTATPATPGSTPTSATVPSSMPTATPGDPFGPGGVDPVPELGGEVYAIDCADRWPCDIRYVPPEEVEAAVEADTPGWPVLTDGPCRGVARDANGRIFRL